MDKVQILNLSGYQLSEAAWSRLEPFAGLAWVTEGHIIPEWMPKEINVIWTAFTRVDKTWIDKFPLLKAVVCPATGLDHIDEEYCAERGIEVLSLRGEAAFLKNVTSTAEHTIGLMLQLARKLDPPMELRGKRLGILGYGRVGMQVAQIARGFQIRNEPWDPRLGHKPDGDHGVPSTWLSLLDILTIHCPLNDETRYMIDMDWFECLPDHAIVINTARPHIILKSALMEALFENDIRGYAADFLHLTEDDEDSWFPGRVVQTDHIAGNTREAREDTEVFMAEKLKAWAESQ